MRIKLIAVGSRMPRWVEDGWQEYAKRMPSELSLELVEIPLTTRGKNCLLYTSPSPRDRQKSRMPSSA